MKTIRNALMASFDVFISFIFIGPLGIFFWRGLWGNMDVYLFEDNPELSIFLSFSIGTLLTTLISIFKDRFRSIAESSHNVVVYFVYSRCYTYICGFAIINKWRGIWLFQDHFTGKSYISVLSSCLIGVSVLGVFRCLRSAICPPLLVVHDADKCDMGNVTTRFITKVRTAL